MSLTNLKLKHIIEHSNIDDSDKIFIEKYITNIENRHEDLWNNNKALESKVWELEHKLNNCTLRTYLKGLRTRTKRFFKNIFPFVSYTGERTYHFGIERQGKEFSFCYWNEFKTGTKYICLVTSEKVTRWYFRKDGKPYYKKESWTNTHTYGFC